MILQEVTRFLQDRISGIPEISEIVIGQGFTGVLLSDGNGGIAMNMWKGGADLPEDTESLLRNLIGRLSLETASELAGHTDKVCTSVRVAILNALSVPFMEPEYLEKHGLSVDASEKIPIHRGVTKQDTVTLVGFGGMVHGLSRLAGRLFVSELDMTRGRSLIFNDKGRQTGPARITMVHADEADAAFEQSSRIFVTGSALVTHTMEDLLRQCPDTATVVLYGHTAAFFPGPLFQRGVGQIRTRVVTDGPKMMDLIKNSGPMVERFFPRASRELLIEPR